MAGSTALRFAPHLRELRIHLCQRNAASQGVREFIEQNYISLKKTNPKFPILIRECSGVQPRVWARYEMGQESSAILDGLSANQVMDTIARLNASQ